MDKIRDLYKKYKDVVPYVFFGVCTTIVNVVVYWLFAYVLMQATMLSTIIAWIAAVLFAYITNRKWVFHSQAYGVVSIMKEIVSFFSCRLATGIIDWLCMYIFVDVLGANGVLIKLIANIIVIVLNYVASKLLIFRRKSDNEI